MAVGKGKCFKNPTLDRFAFFLCTMATIALFFGGVLLVIEAAEGDELQDEKSFNQKGNCILIDIYHNESCSNMANCLNPYQYEWQVLELDKCEETDNIPLNYTFIQYSSSHLHYNLSSKVSCYTDSECTDILLSRTEYDSNGTVTFIYAFILFIIGLCFVMYLWSWSSKKPKSHENDRKFHTNHHHNFEGENYSYSPANANIKIASV